MPSQGDWKAICIRKKSGIRLNHGVIKNLAARFGIVQSIKDTSDILFINFNKITNINACIDEFRHNGFNVEESKRNKMQTNGNSSQTSNESSFSSPCLPLNQNASSVIGSSVPPNLSNFSTLNTKTGHCVLCQKNTVLVCQRCTDFYCSVECQLKDWHSHRFICFPMPKLVDVSQLQSEFHHAYNVALPHLIQNPLAPVIFEEPKNNTFMNQSRHPDSPARNSRNKNQSEAMTNSPKPNDCNNNASKMNNNATKKNNNSNDKGSNKQSSKENISSPVSEEAKKSTPPNSICGKRKCTPDQEDEIAIKIKKEDRMLEIMIEVEEHLIEEKNFVDLSKKMSEAAKSFDEANTLMYLSKIKQLNITAALLLKCTNGFNAIRKLCESDNPTISEEVRSFYTKLVQELFWFIKPNNFWPSYMSLKEKIKSYFEDFPGEYTRMIEIPEDFVMMNLGNSKTPSLRSETSSQGRGQDEVAETEQDEDENEENNDYNIEAEEETDNYDVIPLLTPDRKVVRLVVKFENGESNDANREKTGKLIDAIESGDLDYKCLPKGQVILYDDEEENRQAVQFLKVDRQTKEERKFTEITFKIKSCLSVKCDNIDFKAVFKCFEDLKLIKYSATLLLKHSNCVLVIKNFREFDVKKFKKIRSMQKKLNQVRFECKKLYIYYKSFFPFLPGLKNFWKEYVDCKSKFDELLCNLSKDERACVTELPKELLDSYA